ncbi:MAG: NPCBM/NEW2 domain-containing protein [Aeoliella sp.]
MKRSATPQKWRHCVAFVGSMVIASCSIAVAEEFSTSLKLTNGETLAGQVIALRDGTLEFQPAGEVAAAKSLALGEWLRWSHPVEQLGRPRVRISASTWLVTKKDWAGKVPIQIEGDTVTIDNETFGEVRLKRQQIDCILLEAAKEPAVARRLLAEAGEPDAESDRVWLVEGDLLSGEVVSFDGTRLEFVLGDKPVPILASRIAAVTFALPAQSESDAPKPVLLVGLADGSLIEALELRVDSDQLELTTPEGWQWSGERKDSLRYVQSLAPEIVYLSDLQPADYRHTPYFATSWPLARDRNLLGNSLTEGAHRYAKGLSMHSAARAVYRVPEGARRFCAEVAIDAIAGRRGSVVFRVYLLGNDNEGQGGLASAYESTVVRGGEQPRSVSVDINGAQAVVLVVDYADFGDELDHGDWLDARFVQ